MATINKMNGALLSVTFRRRVQTVSRVEIEMAESPEYVVFDEIVGEHYRSSQRKLMQDDAEEGSQFDYTAIGCREDEWATDGAEDFIPLEDPEIDSQPWAKRGKWLPVCHSQAHFSSHTDSDWERDLECQVESTVEHPDSDHDYSYNELDWDLRSDHDSPALNSATASAVDNFPYVVVYISAECSIVIKKEPEQEHTITVTLADARASKQVESDVIDLTED